MTSDGLLTPDDLATHFGIDRRAVMALARRNNWPRVNLGPKTFRWTTAMVEQIERLHTITPAGVKPTDGRTQRSARRAS